MLNSIVKKSSVCEAFLSENYKWHDVSKLFLITDDTVQASRRIDKR